MTRIIYVVYTKEYLTPWQITGANLKKYAFLCDYSEVKIDDLIDSPMYSTPMQVVSISPCESLADTVVNGTGYGRRWHRYERPHDTTNDAG